MKEFQRRVLDQAAALGGNDYRVALTDLVEWSDRQSALVAVEHRGTQDVIKYVLNTSALPDRVVWSSYAHQGKIALQIKDIAPLDSEPLRTQFRRRLESIAGMRDEWIPSERPSVLAMPALTKKEVRGGLKELFEWSIEQIARVGGELVDVPTNDQEVDYDIQGNIATEEGRSKLAVHLRRERSRTLVSKKKQQAMEAYGTLACEVCRFDFEKTYGSIGNDFCEVHHLRELGSQNGARITSLDDLAIVCSNCHRMLHKRYPALDVAALRQQLKSSPVE